MSLLLFTDKDLSGILRWKGPDKKRLEDALRVASGYGYHEIEQMLLDGIKDKEGLKEVPLGITSMLLDTFWTLATYLLSTVWILVTYLLGNLTGKHALDASAN